MLWILLDGVGHPDDAPPGSVWEQNLPSFELLLQSGQALDARLGVDGLPQSGTGQTSWLCGVNAAKVMNRHYGPQPGPTLLKLLAECLPVRLARAGGRVELLNFYPPGYFAGMGKSGVRKHGCIPQSVLGAGRKLNPDGFPHISPVLGLEYGAPFAATHSLEHLHAQGLEAGHAAGGLDLGLLDLWLSDTLGHLGATPTPPDVLEGAKRYMRYLDAFLSGVLESGCPFVVSSDHGNFEDLSLRTHTYARVPLLSHGLELPLCADIAEGGQAIAELFGALEG